MLEKYGWDDFFAAAFRAHEAAGALPARVVEQQRGAWGVVSPWGELLVRHLRAAEPPVAGDWVALSPRADSIEAVLPRRSVLQRKVAGPRSEPQVLAANIDVLFIVMGLDGDYNLRRLERFLVTAAASGARPVVLLNKLDLCPAPEALAAAAAQVSGGAPVHLISALAGSGVEHLDSVVRRGETAALVGSSGAGKSTLLNRLLGECYAATAEVLAEGSRGRHTTTHRELVLLERGWLLADMPGLREVQLWAGAEDLDSAFPEIAAHGAACRFRDCRHAGEPGCAVAVGVATERLAQYHKLERELAALERRHNHAAAAEEKRKWKSIHKTMRHFDKRRYQ